MGNIKKEGNKKNLSSKHITSSTKYSNNMSQNKESNNEKVRFHSEFINKIVGNLDITV